MILFKDVYKAFGSKRVLNGLNLEIPKGSVFFILGRSGTGKSVSLKHLVGLLKADSGKIFMDGEEIQNFTEEEFLRIRKKCGMVFQLPALIDSRTVYENLCFGVRHLASPEKHLRCERILKEVSLDKLLATMHVRTPPQLSYGEQKRIAIARTLMINPDYILYDEPTTGIDPATSKSIHALIQQISRNLKKTSVVVSHDMKNALRTADLIAVLHEGKCVDHGTPDEIYSSPHPLTRSFLEGVRR